MDHVWRKRGEFFNGKEELEPAPCPMSGKEIDVLLKNWKECPPPGKKATEGKSAAGCMESEICFPRL